jgi:LysM repeat protein
MHAARRLLTRLSLCATHPALGRRGTETLALVALALALTGCQVTIGAVPTPTPGGPGGTPATPPVLVEVTPVDSPTPAPPSPTPGPVGAPITYKIQPGDSLSSIAQKFGVTVDDIVKANNIENPNEIYAGQEIIIPPPKPGGTGQSAEATPTKAP